MTITIFCLAAGLTTTLYASSSKPENSKIQLRVTVLPYLSFAPLYIAQSEGYFAQQGLDVELVRFQNNSGSLAALLTGRVDVDTIFNAALLNAIARGEKVRVVANKGLLAPEHCPADGFLVRDGLVDKLKNPTPELLKSLTYGVDLTWLDSYFLEIALNKLGVKLSEVKTKYVPNPAARMEALVKGNLDIAFLSEPFISRLLSKGGAELWLPASSIVPNFSLGVVTFGPNLLVKDNGGEIGARFMRAYLQGISQMNEGKTPRNIEILSQFSQLAPDMLEGICWPSYTPDGLVDAQATSGYSEWATRQGLTDKALTPDEFWEPRFVEEAANE